MNRLAILMLLTGLSTAAAVAQEVTSPTRTLNCTNKTGKISIGICGVKGCSSTVTTKNGVVSYLFKRTKTSDGGLSYATRPGLKPRCSVTVGPLRSGVRPVTSASCARSLVGAACKIDLDTATPTPTVTPVE